jgi:peroxiredoxin
MNLRQEIDAFSAEAKTQIPPEFLQEVQTSIDRVRGSGVLEAALGVGDYAPDFMLQNASGKPVSLADLLKRGPLIISFYRGTWCPYCNLELKAYQRILKEIRSAGGDFIAISPQTPDNSLSTAQRNALEFEVLSDIGNKIAVEFGIAYATPEIVKRIAASFGADIKGINGGADDRLPISAIYVVNRDRRIMVAEVEPDFRIRLEPEVALAMIRDLSGGMGQPVNSGAEA